MSNASGKRRPPKGRPASTFIVNINRPPEGEDKSKLDTPNEADTSVDEVVSRAAKAAVKLSPDALKPVYERSPEKLITPELQPPEPVVVVPPRPDKLFQIPVSTSGSEASTFKPTEEVPIPRQKVQPNGSINVSLAISLPHGNWRDWLASLKRQGNRLYAGLKALVQSVARHFLAFNQRLQIGIVLAIIVVLGSCLTWIVTSTPHHDGTASLAPTAKTLTVDATPTKTTSVNGVSNSPIENITPATTPPAKLSFTPVVPAGEPQLASLDTKSHYNSSIGSYTFSDLFVGYPITVSEQQLPSSFRSATAAVSTVAASAHATVPIITASGVTAYMVTKSSGAETVIYATKSVLVFIQTTYPITAAQWPNYLNSLQ